MTEQEYILLVCNNIKQLRMQKGIKQVDLAYAIGIDDSSIRRIESGRTSPTLKTLIRIAGALNVEVQDLLPDSNNPKSS